MFHGFNKSDTRQVFFESWHKFQQNQSLTPLEQEVVKVISEHPEFHKLFELSNTPQLNYAVEDGELNPFLHLGLHLSIRDQLNTNRPVGINDIFQCLLEKYGDNLEAEHLMMDCLAETLWKAQRTNTFPDELFYLSSLKGLIK